MLRRAAPEGVVPDIAVPRSLPHRVVQLDRSGYGRRRVLHGNGTAAGRLCRDTATAAGFDLVGDQRLQAPAARPIADLPDRERVQGRPQATAGADEAASQTDQGGEEAVPQPYCRSTVEESLQTDKQSTT
uniref:(northern house mosquito) hypothetical protein n=1 Tax=Culex pipiens TaxID=7175 RepID=A0A8D8FEP7_CULPI